MNPPREHLRHSGAPSLWRRLLCAVYEGVILFGVVFIAGCLFSTLTQQRNGLTYHNLLAGWIALVVGAYFIWFWTHGGQTLPMKAWRLRLVDHALAPLGMGRAMLRYVLAWLWFLPPLALHSILGGSVPHTLLALFAWMALWASTQWLDPDRQWLHDRLAGTRIVAAP